MGKSSKPKTEVTQYYLSVHYGICLPVDALLRIFVKEKPTWQGPITTQLAFPLSNNELFGGLKKEGGIQGNICFLPGRDDQVMPEDLAQKLGRSGSADCPAFRGLSSLFFYGSPGRGFYWTANNPFIPGVWAEVRRAPVGLTPSRALIFSGTRTPRAICFALDRSTSMAGSRLATLKLAMETVLNLIKASVESGVQIDLSVVTFGPTLQSITRRGASASNVDQVNSFVQALTAAASNTDFRTGMDAAKTFFDATSAAVTNRFLFFITDGEPTSPPATAMEIATQAAATLASISPPVASYGINIELTDTTFTQVIDNTTIDGVPVVSGSDPSGLVTAVTNALFGDNVRGDANPAHIIYECLTDTNFGMGTPASALDVASFEAASLTLQAEGFGLSILWLRQTSIETFIQEVLDHIQGVLYVDPASGLLTLRLVRGDYNPDTLPELTPDYAVLNSFSRKLWGDIVNEIVVTWTNPENEQEETVTAQDLASIAMQGGVVSDSRNYYGVRNAEKATELAWRDLRSAGQPLASAEAVVDRSLWQLRPASVVKLTWPEYGVSQLVMRITGIEYGKPGDPTIKLSLIEDVYGLDIGTFDSPPTTEWIDPSQAPEPLEIEIAFTLPLFWAASSIVAAFVESPEYPEVVAGVLASSSQTDAFEYELWDEVTLANGSLQWQRLSTSSVLGRAFLDDDLPAEVTSTGVMLSNLIGNTGPVVAGFVVIGDGTELGSEIALIDEAGTSLTLVRGTLDTVPREWPAGTSIWFIDDSVLIEDPVVRAAGELVDYRLRPRTSQGLLPLESAADTTATLSERPWLPNRPANVVAAGVAFSSPDSMIDASARVDPWITVTWAVRNRLLEDAQVLAWDAASQAPEDGQTTTIEVRDIDGTLLATHDDLTGTTFDVPDTDFGGSTFVELRTFSKRSDADGDFVSLQYFSHWLRVAGLPRLTEFDETRLLETGAIRLQED